MKIVCDSCQAKYSVSDDKVVGKVFKIRCKKCSNVIIVRAGAEPAPAKDTRVLDDAVASAPDAIWHLVIDQGQVGPMTAAEVERKLAGGEIDGETFTWCEGQADWLPLSQVDAFASLVVARTSLSSRFDPVRTEPPGTQRDDDHDDLFAAKPAAVASDASAGAAPKMRGERNESSVLFSLGNLEQLARGPAATPATATSAPGAAAGEGSGLIDIRSMASAYIGGGAGPAQPASARARIGSLDDLPVFGGGGFSEPAVIVPTVQRAPASKLLYVMIAAVGVLAIAAVVMVVLLVRGNKPTQVAAAAPPPPAPAHDPGPAVAPAPAPVPPPTTPAVVAAAPEAKAPAQVHREIKPAAAPAPHADPAEKPAATKPADPPAAKEADGCEEITCMVNDYAGACCAKFRPHAGAAAKPSSDLPEGLDKPMISAGIEKVRARVSSCGDRSPAKGMVKVHVKVGGDGRVADVSVEASPDDKLGACVVAAMKSATFAKTQNGRSFGYPFVF